jgi:alanine racemase
MGVDVEILILGYTRPALAERLAKLDLITTLVSAEYAYSLAECAREAGVTVRAHAALDTGMNRIGFPTADPDETASVIRALAGKLRLEGLFTHLCVADSGKEADRDFTRTQIARFEAVADRLAHLHLPYVHCLNSAGGITAKTKYHAVARLGILLYGLHPSADIPLPAGARPALSWYSVISAIHTLLPGETVGYGRTFTAKRETRVATIPTGYADGYPRSLSGRGRVKVRGVWVPVIGRVCMDQLMIDVTDVPDAALYDTVTLLGDGYTADDMAEDVGTIGYEIVCDIGMRVPRIYLKSK